jgi:hypothetical protein
MSKLRDLGFVEPTSAGGMTVNSGLLGMVLYDQPPILSGASRLLFTVYPRNSNDQF